MKESVVGALLEVLGKEKVLTDQAVGERYHHIWHMHEALQAKAVLLPRNTKEVSQILAICHQLQQPVVVHGGLTNMVGSTETNMDEVVISMEKMNTIEEVDEKSRTITVQAGAILENVQLAAQEKGLIFPLSFGAKGSAQMGGVIATNAGGLRVFKFGMARNLVLGLEAVLADGTIVSSMKKIIKDNSGYDLKQLFIGSEGTLGVVTKAILKLYESPKSRTSAIVAFDDYEKVVDFLKFIDGGLGGNLSGFELIWGKTYFSMTSPPAQAKPPLPHGYKFYVLLEALGSDQGKDQIMLEELLEVATEQELITNAALAQSESNLNWFWGMREDVDVLVAQCNNDQHFDISLPVPHIGPVVDDIIEELYAIPEVEMVFSFGHAADGNIHLIIGKSKESKELINQINLVVYAPLQSLGGSVSAEHGIGLHKKPYLPLVRSKEEIQLMKRLKKAMDPLNILNRDKVL